MSTNKMKWVWVCCIWVGCLTILALGYRWWWAPTKEEEAKAKAAAEAATTLEKTSSHSRYKHTINFAIDAFSGYAPIRSSTFRDECAKFGLRVELMDDGANYEQRLKNIIDGKADMGVFTVDALIKTSADLNNCPATIVAIVDESRGADALVAAGKEFPNLDSLNYPDVKIVCVANSPTETLARVVMTHFSLENMDRNPFEFVDSAEAVYKAYQNTKPGDKKVFAMWEPYVSRVVSNPDYHVLIDSSKTRGYIMDVIVVRRSYLVKNEDKVDQLIKSYLTTVFAHRNDMAGIVSEDAKKLGEPLKKDQVERLVKTILWKNTQETFGHFGITHGHGLQHMEEVCRNITSVLLQTGSINKDPTNDQPNILFYDGTAKRLFDSNWHPGFGSESVRKEKNLLALSDKEWEQIKPVGTLHVPRLVYARGTSKITEASETTLQDLSEKLKNWPQYYLIVRGNASSVGNVEANLKLAKARSDAAVQWLVEHGVDRNRIRSDAAHPNGSSTVAFIVGELPY